MSVLSKKFWQSHRGVLESQLAVRGVSSLPEMRVPPYHAYTVGGACGK